MPGESLTVDFGIAGGEVSGANKRNKSSAVGGTSELRGDPGIQGVQIKVTCRRFGRGRRCKKVCSNGAVSLCVSG